MQPNQNNTSAQSVSELIFSLRMQLYASIAAAYGMSSIAEADPVSETVGAGLRYSLHEAELLLETLETKWNEA